MTKWRAHLKILLERSKSKMQPQNDIKNILKESDKKHQFKK